MPVRTSDAIWNGDLKNGRGNVQLGSGAWEGQYNFSSRFEEGKGTNPEELIAAAHAGCFSMALSGGLSAAGYDVQEIKTSANVHVEKQGGGFAIPLIELTTRAVVPGIDEDIFQKIAAETKEHCPVSQLVKAAEITLDATLAG